MSRSLIFFLLGLSIISFSWAKEIDTRKLFRQELKANFRPYEDSLCFANYGFKKAAGMNPYLLTLAAVADKKGSCQGMVGVASAVKTRVVFRPEKKKMSEGQLRRQIRRSVHLHKNNCSGKVYIDGYRDLRDLCLDHEDILRRRSLQYNLSLAIKEILPESRTFFFEGPLKRSEKASGHLLKELLSFHKDLARGEFPLMLVRTHVTLVTGMDIERDEDGFVTTITLHHYDPNVVMSSERDLFERTYHFSRDGKSVEGQLIWNISPRSTKLGCLFKHVDVK